MINYTYTFNASGDVQTALDNGSLGKPYVAYIQNENRVDYNSKSPAPAYKGVWNDVEGDHTEYTFTIDDSPSLWSSYVLIGTINCWYVGESSEPVQGDVTIWFKIDSDFYLKFISTGDYEETIPIYEGTEYYPDNLSIRQAEDPTDDNWQNLIITLNGNVITFNQGTNIPLNLTTINPTK